MVPRERKYTSAVRVKYCTATRAQHQAISPRQFVNHRCFPRPECGFAFDLNIVETLTPCGACPWSESTNGKPSRLASIWPMVVLPDPIRPNQKYVPGVQGAPVSMSQKARLGRAFARPY